MSLQFSTVVRNAQLDALEVAIGAGPNLCFYTGPAPASTDAPSTGTLVATAPLPADWMVAAAAGVKPKNGVWSGSATVEGVIGYFRINSQSGVTHVQGTCSVTTDGEMILNTITATVGKVITVSNFTLTNANP